MQYLKWVSIDDRRPDAELEEYKRRFPDEYEMGVIVMIEHALVPNHLYYDGYSFHDNDENEYDITHWMQLPPTPNDCAISLDLGDEIEFSYEELMAIFN